MGELMGEGWDASLFGNMMPSWKVLVVQGSFSNFHAPVASINRVVSRVYILYDADTYIPTEPVSISPHNWVLLKATF